MRQFLPNTAYSNCVMMNFLPEGQGVEAVVSCSWGKKMMKVAGHLIKLHSAIPEASQWWKKSFISLTKSF